MYIAIHMYNTYIYEANPNTVAGGWVASLPLPPPPLLIEYATDVCFEKGNYNLVFMTVIDNNRYIIKRF